MNQKKAKALRRAVGFRPSEPRKYTGSPQKTTGPRMQYQSLKRLILKGMPMDWSIV